MLYHLLYPLHELFSFFNVFRYITFRTIYSILTALLIVLSSVLVDQKVEVYQIQQVVRETFRPTHGKEWNPTMGGSLISLGSHPTLFWSDLTNPMSGLFS